jgi:hypothetical protein
MDFLHVKTRVHYPGRSKYGHFWTGCQCSRQRNLFCWSAPGIKAKSHICHNSSPLFMWSMIRESLTTKTYCYESIIYSSTICVNLSARWSILCQADCLINPHEARNWNKWLSNNDMYVWFANNITLQQLLLIFLHDNRLIFNKRRLF